MTETDKNKTRYYETNIDTLKEATQNLLFGAFVYLFVIVLYFLL
jgi:hypothetical protein